MFMILTECNYKYTYINALIQIFILVNKAYLKLFYFMQRILYTIMYLIK